METVFSRTCKFLLPKKRKLFEPHDVNFADFDSSQLAVFKGVIIDRVQRLKAGRAVLKSRKSRASYGVGIRRPYDAHKHVGQACIKGLDGRLYVCNQIGWITRKVSDPSTAKSQSAVDAHNSNRVRPSNPKSLSSTKAFTIFYPMRILGCSQQYFTSPGLILIVSPRIYSMVWLLY